MPHLDDLARLAGDARTPPNERHDVNAEIWKSFSSQLTYENLGQIREELFELMGSQYGLQKSVRLEPYLQTARPPKDHPRHHVSILNLNEYGLVDQPDQKSRWFEKRTRSGFYLLKDVVNNVDLVQAVILTFNRHVQRFICPEADEGPAGLRIVRADKEKISDRDKAAVDRIESFLFNCGDTSDYFERKRLKRDALESFVSKMVTDTLSGDACPIELVKTNGGKLSGFHNIDFATVRLCSEFGYEGEDEICGVQVIDGIPFVAYEYGDLIYETRNARSDINSGGYGFAEPEMFLRAVTAYLNAVTFNAAGIDRNASPRGILQLTGKFNDGQLDMFKRQLKMMLSGAANRHGIPIIASEEKGSGPMYIPMDNFDEMFFARWMVFLVSIVCAIYGIDPSEIHFDSFTVAHSPLSGKDTQEKLDLSRIKGFVPLLRFVERVLSIIVSQIDNRYRLKFIGLHQEDQDKKQERLKLTSTVDEMRAADGNDAHPVKVIGGAPTNPSLLGLYMAEMGINPAGADDAEDSGESGAKPKDRGRGAARKDEDLEKAAVVVIERNAA